MRLFPREPSFLVPLGLPAEFSRGAGATLGKDRGSVVVEGDDRNLLSGPAAVAIVERDGGVLDLHGSLSLGGDPFPRPWFKYIRPLGLEHRKDGKKKGPEGPRTFRFSVKVKPKEVLAGQDSIFRNGHFPGRIGAEKVKVG
jgi:hypothetical protein